MTYDPYPDYMADRAGEEFDGRYKSITEPQWVLDQQAAVQDLVERVTGRRDTDPSPASALSADAHGLTDHDEEET